MSNTAEAGRYSLAGFIFQLLGNGVEIIELSSEFDDPNSPRDVLLLERYGQDSATVDSYGQLKVLNQYKFTSTGRSTSRASLLDILEKMLVSANEAGGSVDECGFTLTTNMTWEHAVQELWDIRLNNELTHHQKAQAIVKKLRASKQTGDLPNAELLAKIFIKLDYDPTNESNLTQKLEREAARFGVLPQELETRVNELLGLLLQTSGRSGRREVSAVDCFKALTGIPSPYRLLDTSSRLVREKNINERRELETRGASTMPRSVVADIVNAVCQFPIVLLTGKGGLGKSVALFDAAAAITEDNVNPPGFCIVEHAYEITESRLIEKIAAWRNQRLTEDGSSLDRSLARLSVAYPKTPRLAVCIDGADERNGLDALPANASNFIQALALRSLNERLDGDWDTTLLVTCRENDDWEDIFNHKHCTEGETKHTFDIETFTPMEMAELAATIIDPGVRELIENRIQFDVGGESSVLAENRISANSTHLKLLYRPVLWGIFTELPLEKQRLFLTGGEGSLQLMSEHYFNRFRLKCNRRIPATLRRYDLLIILVSAARSSQEPPLTPRKYRDHWITPATDSGCSLQTAVALFNEACSAGLIRQRSVSRDWIWEYPWFLEYLQEREEI
ncbi:MAG TPA: hypothetical protein DDX19_14030 [Rhodopirellula baltica]|uniref:Uncharacterized protein n=1 Tax=Rhodopirellula baltica (strain DSM 10527 / NCIMB 13988 / SH1) TaxID=243090 RepID=Q7UKA2_RHOBA|nr:hypothetical protein [Rhodopirellula baltica]CAD76979.1 hypothetical protein-transmembrane prediction [Rhodopirellula baltica SH 1]HBE63827.1 hypothetical protein [Rhodopirellula baltica]